MLTVRTIARRTVIATSLAIVAASGIAATRGGPHHAKPAPSSIEPSSD